MRYYCIKQYDSNDCGAACLATISKQYGLKLSIAYIREIAGTDRRGTTAYGLVKAAEKLGYSAKATKGTDTALFSNFPLPCIAHMIVNDNMLHYVVIHKITTNQVIIADPAVGLVKITPNEFFGKMESSATTKDSVAKYKWTGVIILLVPTVNFEKGEKAIRGIRRFVNLILPQKKLILNVFVASVISLLLGVLSAFYFRILIDDILSIGLTNTLHIITIGVILLKVFQVLLNTFRSHFMLYLSQKLDIVLSLSYYRHVLELPMNFFGTRKVGEIITRFNDASHVRSFISSATITIMIDVLMTLIVGIILLKQNILMFSFTLVIAILHFIIIYFFNPRYKRLNMKLMEDNAQLTSYLVESFSGIQTIKAYNAEAESNFKTEKKFITLLNSFFKLNFVSNIQSSLNRLLESVGSIIILWIGAMQVLKSNITIGQLISFNALLMYFLEPIKNLIHLQPMMQTAAVAADRLSEIFDLPTERQENEINKLCPSNLNGDVKIVDISFRYGARNLVLNEINVTVKQGEKVALVGDSGSGKTTLAKLLLNFYTPEKGDILINDTNIKDIKLDILREKIAYVSQETFLFSGSIMENLTYGLPEVTPENVFDVAKMVQAHDFIMALPLRYETMLEENGMNISGGQRQRLAIIHALLKKPNILILDEATSNLDSVTERAIEKTINEYSKNITTFIIAHRLSTVKRCNKIYFIANGYVAEAGTHDELISRKGRYYRLVTAQSLEGDNSYETHYN